MLEALASVRPYMESHGGNVELAGITDGVAQLRLEGHCHGCPASLSTLELAIKDALEQAAPDLLGVEVDGLVEPEAPGRRPSPRWLSLDAADEVEPGATRTVTARGVELLVANVAGTLLAYRSDCAACGSGLGDATLEGELLTCGRCRIRFDLVQAGRAVGSDDVYLEPVPLLRVEGPRGHRGAGDVTAPSRPPPASSPAVVAGLRRLRAHAAGTRARAGDERRRLRPVRQPHGRGPPPSAARRPTGGSCARASRAGRCAPAIRSCGPTGTRMQLLEGFDLSDELWAKFQIPIGLTFFFVTEASGVVALYPSPAGATESELYLEAWNDLVAANPVLEGLEHEVEALIVDRISEPHAYAIVPIDRCYELVGTIKANWQGISGGTAVEDAVGAFFARLRDREGVA